MAFQVTAVQMTSGSNLQANLEQAAEHIRNAAETGSDVVALPEFFALLGREGEAFSIREADGDGVIQSFLSEQAREHQIWLLGGSIPLCSPKDDKLRAASLLFDSDGRCHARYDKIHLFDVTIPDDSTRNYLESKFVDPGTEVVVAQTPFGRFGLSICYDMRFPELYRSMAKLGMDVVFVPSAFTAVTGRAHWESLLRARAIENQCYLVAPAQCGKHDNGRETYGDAMIVNPWGDVLSRLPEGNGLVTAEIELDTLMAIRKRFPALKHRTLR